MSYPGADLKAGHSNKNEFSTAKYWISIDDLSNCVYDSSSDRWWQHFPLPPMEGVMIRYTLHNPLLKTIPGIILGSIDNTTLQRTPSCDISQLPPNSNPVGNLWFFGAKPGIHKIKIKYQVVDHINKSTVFLSENQNNPTEVSHASYKTLAEIEFDFEVPIVCTCDNSSRIKHLFVLMLENRSFDHMLGFSGIKGRDAVSGLPTEIDGLHLDENGVGVEKNTFLLSSFPVTQKAWFTFAPDPGHEFDEVVEQLIGDLYPHTGATDHRFTNTIGQFQYPNPIENSGFVSSFQKRLSKNDLADLDPNTKLPKRLADIMACFTREQLPVLTTLAEEFAVCDNWFSSMPGPTWPNRFFLHAASSGGMDSSCSDFRSFEAWLGSNQFKFANGTIFDRLDDKNIDWTVYAGNSFAQVWAIEGMPKNGSIREFEDFKNDINNPGFSESYIFIEPRYEIKGNGGQENSQHPPYDVRLGECLVKEIYEAIRNSPIWKESALIITYDEHGGFYDHVKPPQFTPPGDQITNGTDNNYNFDFQQWGVRIPAIVISPLIPKNTIDHTLYDHTSILKTLEETHSLKSLTNRDENANSVNHLFCLSEARNDTPQTLPSPQGFDCKDGGVMSMQSDLTSDLTDPLDSMEKGLLRIALIRELEVSPRQYKEQIVKSFIKIRTRKDAISYLRRVERKLLKEKKSATSNLANNRSNKATQASRKSKKKQKK